VSQKLLEVRDKFSKILSDPAHLNASSRQIAFDFLSSHRSLISAEAWDEVTITGLVHIMSSLRLKRPVQTDPDQGVLAGFDVDPIVVVRVVEEGGGIAEKNKGTLSLTLSEAMDYLARHTKERSTNTKRIREWRRLIARVKPFMTREGMTLEEGLKVAAAAEEAKGKRDRGRA
jgi:hypothetical protein